MGITSHSTSQLGAKFWLILLNQTAVFFSLILQVARGNGSTLSAIKKLEEEIIKELNANAILALKEALINIYWKRKDIKTFIYHTINNKMIVTTIDFENSTKDESITILIDRMVRRSDIYKDDLLQLFDAVIHFNDYSHLTKWDDSEEKISRAKNAVLAVRKYAKGYFNSKEEKARAEDRKRAFESIKHEKEISKARIQQLKNSFTYIISLKDPQQRGFAFEKFLNDLFEYYELDPRRSFKVTGEQIDGAFTFDNTDYLVEAKWQTKPINAGDLYKFSGKIDGKLKITLGLFISYNGFSSESLMVNNPSLKSMILMDGSDSMSVLDNRIDLPDLLYRKRRYASETGKIFLKAIEIVT